MINIGIVAAHIYLRLEEQLADMEDAEVLRRQALSSSSVQTLAEHLAVTSEVMIHYH